MINIPIEIGDIVLGGRFKNKKILVKEISTDEYGSPTINGRSILKIRMPKLYVNETLMKRINMKESIDTTIHVKIKKNKDGFNIYLETVDGLDDIPLNKFPFETKELALLNCKSKGYICDGNKDEPYQPEVLNPTKYEPTKFQKPKEIELSKEKQIKLENLIRKILKEEQIKLKELDVTDSEDLIAKAKRFAKLANDMKVLENQLEAMEKEYGELDDEFRRMVEAVGTTKDTFIKAGKILIKIERAGFDKSAPKYKTGFEWLHERVNKTMKELADEAMKMVAGTAKVKSKISVVFLEEQQLKESPLSGAISKIKIWWNKQVNSIFNLNKKAKSDLDMLAKKFGV